VTPIETDGYVTNELLENEALTFDTTAIGEPHYVKISYFPNWHVEGAEGPFLTSPSFMMVIPTQSHVTLYYGRTMANTVGQVLEVIGWALLISLTIWRLVLWRRRKNLAAAVQEQGPILSSGEFGGSLEVEGQEEPAGIDAMPLDDPGDAAGSSAADAGSSSAADEEGRLGT
jgi:hypothetical protein